MIVNKSTTATITTRADTD